MSRPSGVLAARGAFTTLFLGLGAVALPMGGIGIAIVSRLLVIPQKAVA